MADSPHLGSMRPGRGLGILLYLLLGVAAAMALLGGGSRLGGVGVDRIGAGAFALFLLLFAVYRFTLVRAERYSLGKALYQLGAGGLLLILLVYGTFAAAPPEDVADVVPYLLASPDHHVRRAGCELAGLRQDPGLRAAVTAHVQDPDPLVARECQKAVSRLGN